MSRKIIASPFAEVKYQAIYTRTVNFTKEQIEKIEKDATAMMDEEYPNWQNMTDEEFESIKEEFEDTLWSALYSASSMDIQDDMRGRGEILNVDFCSNQQVI